MLLVKELGSGRQRMFCGGFFMRDQAGENEDLQYE